MTLRVVFDTNVLFSAAGWGGKPGACLALAQDGRVAGITCAEILEELAPKLEWKLGLNNEQVAQVLASLLAVLEVVRIQGDRFNIQTDPRDDKILECALVSQATHIVTGDARHLLPIGQFRGIAIITPAALHQLVQEKTSR